MGYNSSDDTSAKMIGTIVVVAILMGGLGFLLYWALPMLVSLTANLLYVVVGFLVLAAALAILLHPNTRFGIGSLIKSFFRKD